MHYFVSFCPLTTLISHQQEVPFLVYYCSHHVHSPQFAGEDTTNRTQRDR